LARRFGTTGILERTLDGPKALVVQANVLSLMSEDRLQDVIGKLPDGAMRKADECLKAALGFG